MVKVNLDDVSDAALSLAVQRMLINDRLSVQSLKTLLGRYCDKGVAAKASQTWREDRSAAAC